ncbi:MAG: cytochrome c biogenesis protein CcsA [Fimbriimonadaceae bacterium]
MEHSKIDLPITPSWALFLGEKLGAGLVLFGVACFALAFLQQVSGKQLKIPFFALGCIAIFGTFFSLATLFVTDQFAYEYVFKHSEKVNQTPYKIAAVWSGQQGSFLLWATASAIFALLALRSVGEYRRGFLATVSLFLGSLMAILNYETPFGVGRFNGIAYIPPDGNGLAPSLNNYWVVIHPPTIFLGFGSLIVLFGFAVSALIRKDYEDWVPRARPWAMVSLSILGLGLCMGGFWAYETLGWGGFWMWDPVENVSFVPWIMVVVLVHGLIVQVTKKKWAITNLLLAGLPFLAFVYGTFLTRAGFLADVSVHSFATMEKSAHKVLLILLWTTLLGFLGLWIWRAATTKSTPKPAPSPRENGYVAGMVMLSLMAVATAVGMSVPLFQALRGQTVKVVEEHLYHVVLSWFFVPIMLLMAVVPFLAWRSMTLREFVNRILNIVSVTLGVTGTSLFIFKSDVIGVSPDPAGKIATSFGQLPLFGWIMTLFGLCTFVAIANLWRAAELFKRSKPSTGAFIAHIGVAVAMAGLIVSRGFERVQEYFVQPGVTAIGTKPLGPKLAAELVIDKNWDFTKRDNKVEFKLTGDGHTFIAKPGLYYVGDSPMVWPSIQKSWSHDMYVVVHQIEDQVNDPTKAKPGETIELRGPVWATFQEKVYKIKYLEMIREGEAGVAGTSFGAKLQVTNQDGQVSIVTPKLIVGKAGPTSVEATLDEEFKIEFKRMDAADKSVDLALKYVRPVFPLQVIYKPLTSLVWLGVGILTFGGLLAAWNRRRRPKVDHEIEENDAPVPAT